MSHNNTSTKKVKKQRKQRRVLNGYIDIDDVTVEAGPNYINWIQCTKQKLKERECKLMSVRITTLQHIINNQCKIFETNINSLCVSDKSKNPSNNQISIGFNYKKLVINNNIIDECLNKLYKCVELWNGINLRKTKKSLSTFRKYFVTGKCWFDQKKKNILAPYFWVKLFQTLQEFANYAASEYFNQNQEQNQNNKAGLPSLYATYLLFQIISGIFNGQLHFAATKPQPIIPCGILKTSTQIGQYFQNLHHSLNIQQLVQQYSAIYQKQNVTAKEILELVKKQLTCLCDKSMHEFVNALQYSDDIKFMPEISNISNETETESADCLQNEINVCNIRPPTFELNQNIPPNIPMSYNYNYQLQPVNNMNNNNSMMSRDVSSSNSSNSSGSDMISCPNLVNLPYMEMSANNISPNPSANLNLYGDAMTMVAGDLDAALTANYDFDFDYNYNGLHNSSQSVITQRYSPMAMSPIAMSVFGGLSRNSFDPSPSIADHHYINNINNRNNNIHMDNNNTCVCYQCCPCNDCFHSDYNGSNVQSNLII